MPDRPPGDPRELLRVWNEWEEGRAMPGKLVSDLKRLGLPELLAGLAGQLPAPEGGEAPGA